MRNINAIYKNGNFYDKDTKEQIYIADSEEIIIIGMEESFLNSDPRATIPVELNAEEKELSLKKLEGLVEYKKIISEGESLFFNINPRNNPNVNSQFEIILLEDLYVYRKAGWEGKKNQLFDCACKLIHNPSKDIEYFHQLSGSSLNNIYEITYMTYYAKYGSPTVNAFKRFYMDKYNERTTIESLRYGDFIKVAQGEQISML